MKSYTFITMLRTIVMSGGTWRLMGIYRISRMERKGVRVCNSFIVLWENDVLSLLLQIFLEISFICALEL